jgi:hypothetical protein
MGFRSKNLGLPTRDGWDLEKIERAERLLRRYNRHVAHNACKGRIAL